MRPDWSKPSFFPAKPEGLSQTKLGGTMRTFKIYQIRVNNEVYDFVNKDGESHTSAGEKYPEYKAKLETQRGHSRGWSDSYFQHPGRVACAQTMVDGLGLQLPGSATAKVLLVHPAK